jgi:hypothetical protein
MPSFCSSSQGSMWDRRVRRERLPLRDGAETRSPSCAGACPGGRLIATASTVARLLSMVESLEAVHAVRCGWPPTASAQRRRGRLRVPLSVTVVSVLTRMETDLGSPVNLLFLR